jgi:hypothetical protein
VVIALLELVTYFIMYAFGIEQAPSSATLRPDHCSPVLKSSMTSFEAF